MTPQEFKDQMQMIASNELKIKDRRIKDKEMIHFYMDELMCEVLTELGYGEGAKIFENTPKWWA